MMYPYILLRRLMVLLLCCLVAGASLAQESAPEGVPDEEPIDEITVYGAKSLTKLKYEYEVAEENFYDLFSELNDDPQYDVICRTEKREGSHINQRVCRPRYELEVLSQDAQGALGIRGRQRAPVEAVVMEKDKVLRDKIAELASEDPRLLKALIDYRDKYQIFLSERRRRRLMTITTGGGPEQQRQCGDCRQGSRQVATLSHWCPRAHPVLRFRGAPPRFGGPTSATGRRATHPRGPP